MKSTGYAYHRVGVLGGGQLGRMLIQSAADLDIRISCLDPDPKAPCASLAAHFTTGNLHSEEDILAFAADHEIITIEIEHVNTHALRKLKASGKRVYPSPDFIEMIQDKGLQKQFYIDHEIPTAPFELVDSGKAFSPNSYPFVLKSRKGGYDGKGVQVIRNAAELQQAFDAPCVVESWIPFEKELAILVARNPQGEIRTFPLVEMEFNPQANLVELLFSPSSASDFIVEEAKRLAHRIVEVAEYVGILAIEFFLTREGKLLVNEMAPRPHNSGHHTIEANVTSQYAQHLRAICGLPLGDTRARSAAAMVNILGAPGFDGPVCYEGMETVLAMSNTHVHLYGKERTKPFRKMGHVTVCADNVSEAVEKARLVYSSLISKS
jgi:5-(carboxyamino)imidazole ribonucleotide synthase